MPKNLQNQPKKLDCTIIVVKWDEMAGPTIVDVQPPEKRESMESIAVQIYFSGVAVFGHEWTPQRAELSFPLVSLGPEYIVKVGFDAWPDPEVRGGYRPFYMGFVMTHESADLLQHFIDLRLPTYLDKLKSTKSINLQMIYAEMVEYFERLNAVIKQDSPLQEIFDSAHVYTIKDAQQDLDEAIQLWNSTKNIESAWKAERAALFLEKFDYENAGDAYFLAGNVYLHHNEFLRASRTFQQAAKNYLKAENNNKAARAYFLAGTSAIYTNQMEDAETALKQAINWTKDSAFLVELHLTLAKVHENMKRWNNALENYQEALKLAESLQDLEKKAEIHHAKSILYRNMGKDHASSDPIYLLEIQKSVAEELQQAAESWQQCSNNYKAAVAYLQSAQQYFKVKSISSGITAYQKALASFYEMEELFSKTQNILQLSELLKRDIVQNNVDNEDVASLMQELLDVETKLIEDLEKKPTSEHASFEKNFLLASLLIDKAKLWQFFKDKAKQLSDLEKAKNYLTNHPSLLKLRLWTTLQLANLYYELEFYSHSFKEYNELVTLIQAELAQNESKTLKSLNLDSNQIKKIIQNYFVCAQQLSYVYYHAAIAALYFREYSEAMSYFKESVHVFIKSKQLNSLITESEASKKIETIIKTRIQKIEEKLPFIPLPRIQMELQELLENAKKSLAVKRDDRQAGEVT